MRTMRLCDLLCAVEKPWVIHGISGINVTGIYEDARKVKKGGMFVCVKGASFDGHDFAHDAAKAGAKVIVAQHRVMDLPRGTTLVRVKDSRRALHDITKAFYAAKKVKFTGITGTKGKTTVSYIIDALLTKATKQKNTVIGTIGYRVGNVKKDAKNTTPSNLEIFKMAAETEEKKLSHVVMEVSSHGLVQGRLDNIMFDSAVVTNITRDHLDFHKTERNYFLAKALIASHMKKGAVLCVNADMNRAAEFVKLCKKAKAKVLTYGIKNKADMKAVSIKRGMHGSEFEIVYKGRRTAFRTHLIGLHNIYNVLSACSAALPFCSLKKASEAIAAFKGVPGRLEKIYHGDFSAVVDFAHTPDSIKQALLALKPETKGRLIALFGAGGDRDRGKRPLMAKAAAEAADIVIVTSDNPRSEKPESIIREVMTGVSRKDRARFYTQADRRRAVSFAVKMSGKGDCIAALGKGPEEYQEIGGVKYPYNDARALLSEIKERLKK